MDYLHQARENLRFSETTAYSEQAQIYRDRAMVNALVSIAESLVQSNAHGEHSLALQEELLLLNKSIVAIHTAKENS